MNNNQVQVSIAKAILPIGAISFLKQKSRNGYSKFAINCNQIKSVPRTALRYHLSKLGAIKFESISHRSNMMYVTFRDEMVQKLKEEKLMMLRRRKVDGADLSEVSLAHVNGEIKLTRFSKAKA